MWESYSTKEPSPTWIAASKGAPTADYLNFFISQSQQRKGSCSIQLGYHGGFRFSGLGFSGNAKSSWKIAGFINNEIR